MCVDVSECYERNGLVCFEQNFLTPGDDGGGLDTTYWGGTTYEHTYNPLEENCVHFHLNLQNYCKRIDLGLKIAVLSIVC